MSLLTMDLHCREVVEFVTDYLEGQLSRRERRSFERHLRACANCAAYLEQVRTLQAATGRVGPEDLDAATLEALVTLFHAHRGDA